MKVCKKCNEKRDTHDTYCSKCGQKLMDEYSSSSEPYISRGCTMDCYGHVRPDMERKREISESFKNRW